MNGVADGALLTRMLNSIPAMVGYWDRSLRNQMANDAYLEFFGHTPESIRGVHIREVLGEEIYAQNLPYIERVLAGEAQLFDREIVDPHGRRRFTQASYIPDEADGEIVGFFVLVTEITERRLAEERLRESEQQLAISARLLERTGELAKVGGWEADPRSGALSWLPEMFRILELDAGEPLSFADVLQLCVDPVDAQRLVAMRSACIDRTTPWDIELPLTTCRGRRIWVRAQGTAIVEDGEVVRLLGTLQDLSERKQMEEHLMRTTRLEAIGRLAGGVAHDFNNMLAVILGRAEVALAAVDPASAVGADLTEISAAATRSADLTKQLLTFARQQTVAPTTLDVSTRVAGLRSLLERLVGDEIEVVISAKQGGWVVRMDPSQIDQILTNLCVNARDAIGERRSGRIEVSVTDVAVDAPVAGAIVDASPGDYVRISVTDNGSGIDDDVLGKIFEPFFTTKEFGDNSGLGLAVVLGAVTQNLGFVTVTSGVGTGTTFAVHLPRHEGAAVAAAPPAPAPVRPRERPAVLVVDDEAALRTLVAQVLEEDGYRVVQAASAREAIELVRAASGQIRLLVTDVVMPEMNGLQLAAAVADIDPTIGMLLMSGYAAEALADHGDLPLRMGYIQKPFSLRDLTATVRRTIAAEAAG